MKSDKNFLRNQHLGLLMLRLSIGGLMLFHGVHKLIHGVGFIGNMLESMGYPSWIAYGAVAAELCASIMIVCGIWTRLASLILAGNMAVAIFMAHAAQIFAIDPISGGWMIELPMLYLLGAIALCFTGAGKYAVTKNGILD